MSIDPLSHRETLRLQALQDLGILDSPPDAEFDALVRAASLVCQTPISLISLVGEDRQWFKANIGLPGISETPRGIAFCAETILRNDVLEIPDAACHPAYADNPLVTGDPHLRFYAGVPLRLADGMVVGTLCVIDRVARTLDPTQRDVLLCLAECASVALQNWRTRRLAAQQEEALRTSEEFLDRTGRIAGVGGWELNVLTGRLFWSAETCRIHGVPPDYEPTLDRAIEFYAPAGRPLIEAAVAHATAHGGGWDLELPFIRADGARLWVRAVGAATLVHGLVTRIAGAFQDVTERVAERAALREAYERDTALFHNSPDILYTVGVRLPQQFVFESFNAALATTTGWQPNDMIGHAPNACMPSAAARLLEDAFARCVEQQTTVTFRMECQTRLGQREFEGSVTPIHVSPGQIGRLGGTLRDMTDHNRMQAELHHRQKIDTIGRLAAGVAHDFNNILQSISSSLELVLDEASPGSATHDIASVGLRSAKRGAYLTHHLLSYARKQILRPQLIALPSLLSDIKKLLTRTLGPHIRIHVEADPALPPLHLDAGQLQTALLNLAINAADAMPHSGTLTIRAAPRRIDGASFVAITVDDTGTGMDEATLAQAADPFFTTKGASGTGLGLSMVQGFAEQSDGTFHIRSTLGQGTEVELRLPSVDACAGVTGQAPVCPPAASRTVLLVDDDQDVLVTTAAFLSKEGYAVVQASHANQALGILAKGVRIDALVTDYAMPGMNGADLIVEARMTSPELPALIITGFADLTASTLPGGPTTVLHKPFRLAELTGALRQVMALPDTAPDPTVPARRTT